MCNHDTDRGHCGGDSGSPLFLPDLNNQGRYYLIKGSSKDDNQDIPKRYTQVAVASFGSIRHTDCGSKPAGFTRLTSAVLKWLRTTTDMWLDPGITTNILTLLHDILLVF